MRARSPDDVKHTGVSKILSLFSCCSDCSPVKFKERKGNCDSHLADSAVEAGLHVVFTLIAGVDKAVLALVVQLHQHTHSAPQGPAEWAELQVLVPGQSQEGVASVHQVTGHQGVRVSNGRQWVKSRASNETDDKEDLGKRVMRISKFWKLGPFPTYRLVYKCQL